MNESRWNSNLLYNIVPQEPAENKILLDPTCKCSFFPENNGAWDFAQPVVPTQTGRTKSTTTTTTPSPIPTTARVTIVNGKKFRLRNNNNTKSTSLVPASTTTSTTMAPNVTKMISNSTPPKVAPSSNITEDENQKAKLLLPSLKLSCPDNNDSTSCLILQYINQYKTTHPADGDPNKGAWKSRFDFDLTKKRNIKTCMYFFFFIVDIFQSTLSYTLYLGSLELFLGWIHILS